MEPEEAIILLEAKFPDERVRSYAVERIKHLSDDDLALFMLQFSRWFLMFPSAFLLLVLLGLLSQSCHMRWQMLHVFLGLLCCWIWKRWKVLGYEPLHSLWYQRLFWFFLEVRVLYVSVAFQMGTLPSLLYFSVA